MASLAPQTGPLGRRLAKHLLRRATFRYTRQMVDQYAAMTAAQAVTALFDFDWNTPRINAQPIDPANGQPWINGGASAGTGDFYLREYVRAWFLNEALNDETARFRMMFFLHGIFNVHSEQLTSGDFFDYLELLRFHADGSYRDLAQRMTRDSMMLSYLSNRNNTKWNPNENYAREFLELFTIGKGPQIGPGNYTHYTEQDVVVGAQLLTGWKHSVRTGSTSIDPVTGLNRGYANPDHHTQGDKTFSAAFNGQTITGMTNTGTWAEKMQAMEDELTDYVDMVFAQDQTARHIVRKIYIQFVSKNITPEIETDILDPLAVTFRSNNYDLGTVMKQLFESQHFFGTDDNIASDDIIGAIIKSPLDNLLQTLSFFEVQIPDHDTDTYDHYRNFWRTSVMNTILGKAGLDIFQPPNVAGYPAYYQEPQLHRAWFSSSTIVARYKLPDMLVKNRRLIIWGDLYATFDIVDFVENSGVCTNTFSAAQIVADMVDYLCAETPDTARMDYFVQTILDGNIPEDWTEDWGYYLGDRATYKSVVATPLENFFKALLYSPEYQVL